MVEQDIATVCIVASQLLLSVVILLSNDNPFRMVWEKLSKLAESG
jgi:hypothetical protein